MSSFFPQQGHPEVTLTRDVIQEGFLRGISVLLLCHLVFVTSLNTVTSGHPCFLFIPASLRAQLKCRLPLCVYGPPPSVYICSPGSMR